MGHQLRIRRHLFMGHGSHMLGKKLVVLGRVKDAQSNIVGTTLVEVDGKVGLIESNQRQDRENESGSTLK